MYKYTDKKGSVNFTDCYECIPKEYRDQIKKLPETPSQNLPESKGVEKEGGPAPGQEGKIKESPKPDSAESPAQADREKEARGQMRKERQAKQERIEELRKEIEAKRQELGSLRTTWMVYDRIRFNQINQEITALQNEIQSIQNELDSQE